MKRIFANGRSAVVFEKKRFIIFAGRGVRSVAAAGAAVGAAVGAAAAAASAAAGGATAGGGRGNAASRVVQRKSSARFSNVAPREEFREVARSRTRFCSHPWSFSAGFCAHFDGNACPLSPKALW